MYLCIPTQCKINLQLKLKTKTKVNKENNIFRLYVIRVQSKNYLEIFCFKNKLFYNCFCIKHNFSLCFC